MEKAIEANKPKEDPEMEVLVDHISDLASKVLEIFGEKSQMNGS